MLEGAQGARHASRSAQRNLSSRIGLMLRPVTTDMFEKVPGHMGEEAHPRPSQKERDMDPTPRVLIIDDNAVNRRLAQVLFQKLGWEVEPMDSGERALLHLAMHRYDLILLDINMPGMNGLDVCRHIRADPRLREVRVIAYTAHVLPAEQQHFLASGFDAVLLKPLSFRVLQEMLLAQTPCP